MRIGAALGLAILLAACGGGGDDPPPPNTNPGTVATVRVTPAPATVDIGATIQLTASPVTAAGAAVSGRSISWSSSATDVATVSATGLVSGVASGTATISATADGITGTATVQVTRPAAARCTASDPVVLGASVTGQLSTTDCQLSDNSFADRYLLTLTDSTPVRIVMRSADVDAFLFVQDEGTGAVIAENDDGATETNARIERVFGAGRYIVVANSFSENEVGTYTLSVARADPTCLTSVSVTASAVITDTLRTSSCLLPDSTYARRYRLNVVSPVSITMTMNSTAIDSYLFVESTGGVSVARNDNGGGGRTAQLAASLPIGSYIITATSAVAGGRRATGEFALTLSSRADPCAVQSDLTVGTTVRDTLTSGGCKLPDGGFVRRYSLTVPTPTAVRLDLSSAQFDPYLFIQLAGTAATLAEDDDSGPGLDAQVLQLLTPGDYVVTVATAVPGEIGTFSLGIGGAAGSVRVGLTPATVSLTSGGTQQLTAAVTGSTNTAVAWRTSARTVADVDANGLVRAIAPGTATITATSAADPAVTATAAITVTASAQPNLDIALVTVTQSMQTADGRIALVAGRPAAARVFVRADRAGIPSVPVRLRVFNGATVVGTINASAPATPSIDQGCCSANITIPDALLRDGMTLTVDVDPDNTVTESNETDNAWPLTGRSKAIRVVTVPPLNIRLVPVQHSAAGTAPTVSASLTDLLRRMYPVAQLNVVVAPTYTTELSSPLSNSTAWSNMLREMEVLRAVENSSAYYYAVLPQKLAGGIVGIATLGGYAGVGISGPEGPAAETFTHEMGHSFARRHAPSPSVCGSPSGVDPAFPRSRGDIGFYGFDVATGQVAVPSRFDIMGYCDDPWVSEYTYLGVMNYLRSGAVPSTSSAATGANVLLLTGSTIEGTTVVEPLFTVAGTPTRGDAAGRLVAEGLAADGRVLFRHRFAARAVTDIGASDVLFHERIAIDEATRTALARVAVRDVRAMQPTTTLTRRLPPGVTATDLSLRVQEDGGVRARSLGGARHEVTWNTSQAAGVIIRDRATGRVLAMGRHGVLTFEAGSLTQVEALVSDGVTSVVRTLGAVGGL